MDNRKEKHNASRPPNRPPGSDRGNETGVPNLTNIINELFAMILDEELTAFNKRQTMMNVRGSSNEALVTTSTSSSSTSSIFSDSSSGARQSNNSRTSTRGSSDSFLSGRSTLNQRNLDDLPEYGVPHCDMISDAFAETATQSCQSIVSLYQERFDKCSETHLKLVNKLKASHAGARLRRTALMDKLSKFCPI